MITPNHDRCLELALAHHLVEGEPEAVTITEPHPADARRQSLEADLLPGQPDPVAERFILGKHLQHQIVGGGNVELKKFQQSRLKG